MKLANVSKNLSKVFGRTGLVIRKFSPEILMGVGVVGVVAAGILACRATLKVEQTIDEAKETIDSVDRENKKELVVAYSRVGLKFVKLYGPSISLGMASIGCLLGAHGVMKKRNVALVAAYKAVEEGFNAYRKRVVDELGEETDYMYKHGLKKEAITETVTDENGNTKKVKSQVLAPTDTNSISVYSRFFDETCSQWSKTPEYNLLFLRGQQSYFNEMLKARGHVFLNEVYDALGMERSQAGTVVGWFLNKEGDNYIDFGLYENESGRRNRAFVNGIEPSILLDFNVDGVIYDLL